MLGKKGKKKSVYAIVALAGSVLLGLCFSFAPRNLQPPDGVPEIRVNQVGYFPGGPKLAVVTGDNAVADFYILGKNLDTVYHGRLADKKKSGWSSLDTRLADFSSINNPGRYTLVVAGDHPSYPFEIRDDIYREVGRVVLKGFYFQRSDQSLTNKYAGEWARAAGHPDTSVLVHPSAAGAARPAGTKISSAGGWYDAGDYNKYIVNSGITMGTLLSAYEDFPEYYRSLETGIPESGNGIPDLLDETLYNLRWMLTMQDPADGGVYHKCTNASFDGMVMPGVTRDPRYVVQKGTAATLDFAAVTAQAARVFGKFGKLLPGLSDSCRKAALKAWEWSLKNPAVIYSQDFINKNFSPAITTGEYGDRHLDDEWFWAAAELYATTGSTRFASRVGQHLQDVKRIPSWSDVAMLGFYTLLRNETKSKQGKRIDTRPVSASMLQMADGLISSQGVNAFGTVMGQSVKDFIWGSNSVAANQGILLVNAFLVSHDQKYLDAAISNVDYLLGRNATGYSFITGIGTKSPMFPHHRPSVADGVDPPIPGLLVAGPNPGRQDKCEYPHTEPETAYVDVACSYASNEIAINWNAPVVYLVNAVQALSGKIGK